MGWRGVTLNVTVSISISMCPEAAGGLWVGGPLTDKVARQFLQQVFSLTRTMEHGHMQTAD